MKKLITTLGLSLVLCSCAGGPQPTTVEGKCIMSPKRAAKKQVEYKGQMVGFCCNRCMDKWSALSESEKDAKLASK